MKNPTIALVALVALALSVLALGLIFIHPSKTPDQAPVTLGQAGPDNSVPCVSNNGVTTCSETRGFTQASTTVCSIKSPSATSTLELGSFNIRTATTTAIAFDFARDTSFAATTTKIGSSYLVNSGLTPTVVASSTNGQADQSTIFPPNTYFNVKYGGALGALNTLQGACKATFIMNTP